MHDHIAGGWIVDGVVETLYVHRRDGDGVGWRGRRAGDGDLGSADGGGFGGQDGVGAEGVVEHADDVGEGGSGVDVECGLAGDGVGVDADAFGVCVEDRECAGSAGRAGGGGVGWRVKDLDAGLAHGPGQCRGRRRRGRRRWRRWRWPR